MEGRRLEDSEWRLSWALCEVEFVSSDWWEDRGDTRVFDVGTVELSTAGRGVVPIEPIVVKEDPVDDGLKLLSETKPFTVVVEIVGALW